MTYKKVTKLHIKAKEVMFSSALLCLFVSCQDCEYTTQPIFTKFSGKMAHGHGRKH